MPRGICRACSEEALSAIHFRQLCKDSLQHWTDATAYLSQIHEPTPEDKVYYVFYTPGNETIVRDQIESVDSTQKAIERINTQFQSIKKRVKRFKRPITSCPCHCPDCGKVFSAPIFLNSHLRNTMKRSCTQCGLIVPRSKMAQHLKNGHDIQVLACDICYKLFSDQISLLEHTSEKHNNDCRQCKVCGSSFLTDRSLNAHMYVHSLFHCKSCSLSFENRKCYKHHQMQCSGKAAKLQKKKEDQYICAHCGFSYNKKPSLRVHIIQKHMNVLPYVCETCGKRTSTVAHLKSHEAIHTTVRNVFECYCGAKMRTELGFNLHQRIHTGERPYECEECGDKFLSASRRLDHIKRRHRSTKDMPHGCDKCSARFVRPFELKKHYLAVHYAHIDVTPAKRAERRKAARTEL